MRALLSCLLSFWGKLIWKMCLLTHILPSANILFKIGRICHSKIRSNYLEIELVFLNFLFHFWNLHQILNILKKKKMAIADVFLKKLQTVKNLVRPLSEKCRFGTTFDSQPVKVSQILAKLPSDHFYYVFSSFWRKLIWKMSFLIIGEILGVRVNTLASDVKYSVQFCENFPLPIKMQLSGNWKTISQLLFNFWDLNNVWNILKKMMVVIANVFPKLQTVKNFVISFCKNRRFGTCFDSQHVKVSRMLAKSPWEHFYHVFSSFWGKLVWKISPLVIGEILGVFVNTLTADGKYRVQYCQNLQLPIQNNFLKNEKLFLSFFWNLHQILNVLIKTIIVIANVFRKLQTLKNLVWPLSKTHRFRTPFASQHVKESQILPKSPWKRFYHVFHHSQGSWFWKCLP